MKFRLIAFFGILLITGTLWAVTKPSAGAMAGTIYGDDQKTPMASAVVRLVNIANGKEYLAGPSGADGTFSLLGIEEGRYAIKIQSNGQEYELGTRVSLKSGSTARMDLLLRSKAKGQAFGMVSPALENNISFFAFNCFKPPMPAKPPAGCDHQGFSADLDWVWIWGWFW
jgi:hypothetical protein